MNLSENAKKAVFVAVMAVLTSGGMFLVNGYTASPYRDTATVQVDGVIKSETTEVSSKIPGRILRLNVSEGDLVKRGDVVAVLETKELAAKKKQALAGLKAAENDLAKAEKALEIEEGKAGEQIRQAEEGVRAAAADLESARRKASIMRDGARRQEIEQLECALRAAKTTYETARLTYQRIKSLADDGVVAEQKADEAGMACENAKNAMDAARARLDLAKEGPRGDEIRIADEQAKKAEAGLNAAKSRLSLAKIASGSVEVARLTRDNAKQKAAAAAAAVSEVSAYIDESSATAPSDGRISNIYSKQGETVSAGYPIMTVSGVKDYRVEVFVDETLLPGKAPGTRVAVEIPSLSRVYSGKIVSINSAGEFAVRRSNSEKGSHDVKSAKVIVAFDESIPETANGLTARVTFGRLK